MLEDGLGCRHGHISVRSQLTSGSRQHTVSALTLKIMGRSHAREALELTPEEGLQAPVLTCVFLGRLAGPSMTEGVWSGPWACGSSWSADGVLVSVEPPHSWDLSFASLPLILTS